MKSYVELESDMIQLEVEMDDSKKIDRSESLKKVRGLCKDFGFTVGHLKGVLDEGRKKK